MKNKILVIVALLLALNISCKKDPVEVIKYPTDGLVSYFNFDNNLKDKLGNTPDGTNYGNTAFTEGKIGKAITLNGTDQYIEFARKTFKNGNEVSVSLWLKRSGGGLYMVDCDDFGVFAQDTEAGLAISLPSTNSAKGTITKNVWAHLVGTYDGKNIKVYINGVLAETKKHAGNIMGNDQNLQLGKTWGGSIDDLFIYNKVLSQAEVNQLFDLH